MTELERTDALWHLEAAHTWMLEYQKKHGISEHINNLDWFEIMGVLARARRILNGDA